MNIIGKILFASAVFFVSANISVATESVDAEKLFKKKCSLCHDMDKKRLGPAVNTMSDDSKILREIIAKGKAPMPAYAGKFSDKEIDALVEYLLANR